jgi:hypothetical protein
MLNQALDIAIEYGKETNKNTLLQYLRYEAEKYLKQMQVIMEK